MMPYTPTEALRHLRNLATKAVPNCVNLDAIDRVVGQTTFTEANTEEALLILDNLLATPNMSDQEVGQMIDMAIQKLRPEPAPVHDAAALEQLALDHPIDLPWMKPAGIVAFGVPSTGPGKCSTLSCDGPCCPKCQGGGEAGN